MKVLHQSASVKDAFQLNVAIPLPLTFGITGGEWRPVYKDQYIKVSVAKTL